MNLHQITIEEKDKEKCNSEELQKILYKIENFYLTGEEAVGIRNILKENGIEFHPAAVIRPFPTMVFDEVSFYVEKADKQGLNYLLESLNFPPLGHSTWEKILSPILIFRYSSTDSNKYIVIKDWENQWKITLGNASADTLINKIKACRITHNG